MNYFGDRGDRLQMMLNLAVNQRLFYALGSADVGPLTWALHEMPGTPMMLYGDEIGIGDDLSLPERECARTPMLAAGEAIGVGGRPGIGIRGSASLAN